MPEIHSNFVLDQKLDLVNPDAYLVPKSTEAPKISEEDQFLLSPPESEANRRPINSIFKEDKLYKKAQSRYEAVASKQAFYWRQTTFISRYTKSNYGKNVDAEDYSPSRKNIVILNKLSEEQRKMIDVAIIKKTFEDVKQFSVGAIKPGAKNVTAKRVINIEPFFEYVPNRMVLAIFDHDVKENLHPAAKQALDQQNSLNTLLIMKKYGNENVKSAALYSRTTEHSLISTQPNEKTNEPQIILGRSEYQFKREYDYFINTESQSRHNVILYVRNDRARFMKPSSIFMMNKKKSAPTEILSSLIPQRLLIDARSYSKEEIERSNKKFREIGCKIKIDEAILNKFVIEEIKPKASIQKPKPKAIENPPPENENASDLDISESSEGENMQESHKEPQNQENMVSNQEMEEAQKEYEENKTPEKEEVVKEKEKAKKNDDNFFETTFPK